MHDSARIAGLLEEAGYAQALAPDVRERVTAAAHEAFTSGVATTIKAAGLVALVAAVLVMVLWPRRAGDAAGASPEPVRQPANDHDEVSPTETRVGAD